MKVFIMTDGKETRWENYLGKRKCEITIDGERLIDRMIRQCKENGIAKEDLIIIGDIKHEDAINDKFPNCERKSQLFMELAKKYQCPMIILNGDCYYTDAIIKDAIERPITIWGHWCNPKPNKHTGKSYGEGYIHKVVDFPWWIENLRKFNQLVKEGKINYTKDWIMNRYLYGWSDIYTHQEDVLGEYDILWDDETDDFDMPIDYDNFLHFTGHKK